MDYTKNGQQSENPHSVLSLTSTNKLKAFVLCRLCTHSYTSTSAHNQNITEQNSGISEFGLSPPKSKEIAGVRHKILLQKGFNFTLSCVLTSRSLEMRWGTIWQSEVSRIGRIGLKMGEGLIKQSNNTETWRSQLGGILVPGQQLVIPDIGCNHQLFPVVTVLCSRSG